MIESCVGTPEAGAFGADATAARYQLVPSSLPLLASIPIYVTCVPNLSRLYTPRLRVLNAELASGLSLSVADANLWTNMAS